MYGYIIDKHGNAKEVFAPIKQMPTKTIRKIKKGRQVIVAGFSNTEFVEQPQPDINNIQTGSIPANVGFSKVQ